MLFFIVVADTDLGADFICVGMYGRSFAVHDIPVKCGCGFIVVVRDVFVVFYQFSFQDIDNLIMARKYIMIVWPDDVLGVCLVPSFVPLESGRVVVDVRMGRHRDFEPCLCGMVV